MVAVMETEQTSTISGKETETAIKFRQFIQIQQQRKDAISESMMPRAHPLMHHQARV